MDRTAWIVVIICAILSFYCIQYQSSHLYRKVPLTPGISTPSTAPTATSPGVPPIPTLSAANPTQIPPGFELPAGLPPAITPTLENNYIRVTFTSHGGAIQQVELLKHKVDNTRNVILNYQQQEPILNLRGWDGDNSLSNYDVLPGAQPNSENSITFQRKLPNGIEIDRSYQLTGDYQIVLTQTIRNPGAEALTLPPYRLNVGVAEPFYKHAEPAEIYTAWLTKESSKYVRDGTSDFDAGGIFGFNWREARAVINSDLTPLSWVAVKNQFFATILTPPATFPAEQAFVERVNLPKFEGNGPLPHGIKTFAGFNGLSLPAQGSETDKFYLYAGPKQYELIKTLGQNQDDVMEFGIFGWIVKILLTSMNYVHRGIPSYGLHWNLNYGWVVIVVTLIIKGLLWPLQSAANRSMKSMQVLQPRIKELQEKYKEEPQKLQTELMKIYKDYGVNPIGGCLPMVFQIPILMAFYTMLQNTIELRHVSWLWVHDLSQPDTIFSLYGIDVNPLPLCMTLTQWLLMKMTPTAQDNQQMKMMQWMPFLFLFMLYNFAAALSLYWTVNHLVTMVQTYRNLRKPLPKLERRKKPNPFRRK